MTGAGNILKTEVALLSDPGRDPAKQVNEDSCTYVDAPIGRVAIVCDGMGGHAGGQDASQLAQRVIVQALSSAPADANVPALLSRAIEAAARDVYSLGGSAPPDARPGSTCVVSVVNARGAFIAHVGDSRAYLIRGPRVTRLTVDHSVVAELVARGVLDPAKAADHPEANQITRALGPDATVLPDVRNEPVRLAQDDVLLLCSDGLSDLLDDEEFAALTEAQINLGLTTLVQALVSLANERGGHDNITVLLIHALEPSDDGGIDAFQQVTVPGEAVSKTLALDAPPPVTERAPRVGHTELMDAPAATERAPVPTVIADPPRPATLARSPVHVAPPVHRSRRHVWIAALITLACLLIAILVWAVRSRRGHDLDDDPPPPPPQPTQPDKPASAKPPPAPKPTASETELVIEDTPDDPPEPTPSAQPTPSATP